MDQDLIHAFATVAHDVATGVKDTVSWEQRKLNPDTEIEAISDMIPVYGPGLFVLSCTKTLARGRAKDGQLSLARPFSGFTRDDG